MSASGLSGLQRRAGESNITNGRHELMKAFLSACYEYLLIASPVALYIILEAMSADEPSRLLLSPEWSIATIFLCFQGQVIYKQDLVGTGRKVSAAWMNLTSLTGLIVIVAASINAYASLKNNSELSTILRLLLFSGVSVAFILFVGAGKLASARTEKVNVE